MSIPHIINNEPHIINNITDMIAPESKTFETPLGHGFRQGCSGFTSPFTQPGQFG